MTENQILQYFDQFWSVYPRRVSRGAAKKAWLSKLKGYTSEDADEFTKKAILAIDAQQRDRRKTQESLRPGDSLPDWKHPATWINAECWLDEIQSVSEIKPRYTIKCAELNCPRDTHGPEFQYCATHLGFRGGRLYSHYRDEMAEMFKRMQKDPGLMTRNASAAKRLLGVGEIWK